jgi:hypothetical protein
MGVARTDFLKVRADETKGNRTPPGLELRTSKYPLKSGVGPPRVLALPCAVGEKLNVVLPTVHVAPVARGSVPAAHESARETPENAATKTAAATNRTFIKAIFSARRTRELVAANVTQLQVPANGTDGG